MATLLELRTTVSPGESFYRRIHYLAASLDRLETLRSKYRLVVSVGSEDKPVDLYEELPWSRHYPITWRWVDQQKFKEIGYRATNYDRAGFASGARHIMLVDSDVIFTADFPELFELVANRRVICGVMAHKPPLRPPYFDSLFKSRTDRFYRKWWARVFRCFDLEPPEESYMVSGWNVEDSYHTKWSPAYFNGGMIFGPGEVMQEMLSYIQAADLAVNQLGDCAHQAQVARTLAMYKTGAQLEALPLRYNYPNDPNYDLSSPEELANVRVIHFLRRQIIHREKDFASRLSIQRLVGRKDLSGSNEVFRNLVSELQPKVESDELSYKPRGA